MTVSTGIIATIAGSGSTGTGGYSGDNGQATAATLNGPWSVTLDSSGYFIAFILFSRLYDILNPYLGNVYISDLYNHRIRKVTVSTGIITTYAGTGTTTYSGDGGAATSATLYYTRGIALDSSGN